MSHSRAKVPMVGRRFSRLVVLEEIPERNIRGHIVYKCQCDCGSTKEILGASLRSGATTSCGCALANAIIKHGMDGTPTYRTWIMMRSRCSNAKDFNYERYGGRGIRVCDRWSDFQTFLKDMGTKPHGMSIDRIDVNGNYEPSNCRWATAKTQANNRRNNIRVKIGDKIFGVEQFAEIIGLTQSGARKRVRREFFKSSNGTFVKEVSE